MGNRRLLREPGFQTQAPGAKELSKLKRKPSDQEETISKVTGLKSPNANALCLSVSDLLCDKTL